MRIVNVPRHCSTLKLNKKCIITLRNAETKYRMEQNIAESISPWCRIDVEYLKCVERVELGESVELLIKKAKKEDY